MKEGVVLYHKEEIYATRAVLRDDELQTLQRKYGLCPFAEVTNQQQAKTEHEKTPFHNMVLILDQRDAWRYINTLIQHKKIQNKQIMPRRYWVFRNVLEMHGSYLQLESIPLIYKDCQYNPGKGKRPPRTLK